MNEVLIELGLLLLGVDVVEGLLAIILIVLLRGLVIVLIVHVSVAVIVGVPSTCLREGAMIGSWLVVMRGVRGLIL